MKDYLTSGNLALGAGITVIAVTLLLILFGKAVSTGHALILAAGAALIILPSVSNVEWSDGGLKYTRRSETSDLTAQIKKLADDNIQANNTIKQTTEALKVANDRLTKLESGPQTSQNGGQDGGGKTLPSTDWGPYAKPTFFDDLIKKSNQSVKMSTENLDAVTTFQKEFGNK